jgi:hypothetical protein
MEPPRPVSHIANVDVSSRFLSLPRFFSETTELISIKFLTGDLHLKLWELDMSKISLQDAQTEHGDFSNKNYLTVILACHKIRH